MKNANLESFYINCECYIDYIGFLTNAKFEVSPKPKPFYEQQPIHVAGHLEELRLSANLKLGPCSELSPLKPFIE